MEGESARIRRADKGKQRASSDEEDAATSSASAQSQAWLSKLNAAQREAVTWSKHGGLQILAGPGSGESHVVIRCEQTNHQHWRGALHATLGPTLAPARMLTSALSVDLIACDIGPTTGKTRVLTCRVAYLIEQCGLRPEDLIVVTFTNKVRLFPKTTRAVRFANGNHRRADIYLVFLVRRGRRCCLANLRLQTK